VTFASRRARWLLVLLGVLLAHGAAVWWIEDALVGWGDAARAMPPRLEAAFVRTLAPAEPPAAAPAAAAPAPALPRPRRARAAAPPAPAASVPLPEPPAPAPEPPVAAAPAEPVASAPAVTAAEPVPPPTVTAAASAAEAAASSPAAAAFDWPPSTRLTYKLQGNYRGEVHGQARVQWVRQGGRYQVHLDVTIGPSFAPLLARSTTSDGELGATGLVPRRYDEATKVPFQSPRRATVQFSPETVTLAGGSTQPAIPGVQDATSQFVQLTWVFTTQPQLLREGNSITLPLALPRRLDRWVYDVVGQERLHTPVGEIDTYHVKPRRAEQRPRGELSAEMWFAPSLQYLPVRIRIRQDADTFVDLMMDAAPLQAEPQSPR
jgi:hypothetical protein